MPVHLRDAARQKKHEVSTSFLHKLFPFEYRKRQVFTCSLYKMTCSPWNWREKKYNAHEKNLFPLQIYCSSPRPNCNLALSSRVGYHICASHAEQEKEWESHSNQSRTEQHFLLLSSPQLVPLSLRGAKSNNSIISAFSPFTL